MSKIIDFKVGDSYYLFFSGSKYKIHICAIIDEHQIVYKWYGKYKQWWHYEIKDRDCLEIYIKRCEEMP